MRDRHSAVYRPVMKTSSFASELPSLIIDQPTTMKAPELLPSPDAMYRALVDRDSTFEGIFYVGVRTTGIFCRPTCSAKKPARENVDFFSTPSQALHGGYRPCLRCHPMDPDRRPPELIERLRAEVERAPGGRLTDKELAALSIDPSTARRQFKRHYGMTFQAYHRARRMGLALREVRKGNRVDEVQSESGFGSASGFRDAFPRIFGDSPTAGNSSAITACPFRHIIVRDEWAWHCARCGRAIVSMRFKARVDSDRRAVFGMRSRASLAIRRPPAIQAPLRRVLSGISSCATNGPGIARGAEGQSCR